MPERVKKSSHTAVCFACEKEMSSTTQIQVIIVRSCCKHAKMHVPRVGDLKHCCAPRRATLADKLRSLFESGAVPSLPFLSASDACPMALLNDVRAPYRQPNDSCQAMVRLPALLCSALTCFCSMKLSVCDDHSLFLIVSCCKHPRRVS